MAHRLEPERDEILKPLRFVKGVGEKLSLLFGKKGILNLKDALFYFPRAYEDRRSLTPLSELKIGMKTSVLGRVRVVGPVFFSRSYKKRYEILLEDPEDPTKRLRLVWFQKPYFKSTPQMGAYVMATGEAKIFRGEFQMAHPDLEVFGLSLDFEKDVSRGILPIYSETEGLFQKTIRRVIGGIIDSWHSKVPDLLPESLREKYKFPKMGDTLLALHKPAPTDDLEALKNERSQAHERMIYEEFFELSLSLARKRKKIDVIAGIPFPKPEKSWETFKANLPFRFTNAQKRVLAEILEDMTSPRPMQRLVQGDVGSGKTVVAAAACLVALEAGYQVAFMAPTEILTDQHRKNFTRWFEGMGFPVYFLTSSLSEKEKREILELLKNPRPSIVFGTHLLFEEKVEFGRLGFVVVDEQHRFGVRQRARLMSKGANPDVLVMTATPIPRTLALTLYGDLDLSVIDELPPGRKPILTKIFTDRNRAQLVAGIRRELKKGRQAYIIFPLIEESEVLLLQSIEIELPKLKEMFSEFSIEVLHGRLSGEEKERILRRFVEREIQILVSTTVVEVGVNVPNASVMVIENAERFGLSQLHQLRGRVGRGSDESFCYLVAAHLGSEEIVKRLRAMEKTQDGFKLAEVDLEMRGPGEFLGTKQSGEPMFRIAKLPRDFRWLEAARRDAFEWVAKDPQLDALPLMREQIAAREREIPLS